MFKIFTQVFIVLLLFTAGKGWSQPPQIAIEIEWQRPYMKGSIEVHHGKLNQIRVLKGKGTIKGNTYELKGDNNLRLRISIDQLNLNPGPEPTVISIMNEGYPFSFLVRDIQSDNPVYIPAASVVVLPDKDNRSYEAVEKEILLRKLKTKIQHIEEEPEVSFDQAAAQTRNMSVPIWLGVSRDMRIFQLSESLPDAANSEANIISPRRSVSSMKLEDTKKDVNYLYTMGRGVGVRNTLTRRLEQGVLPILNSTLTDDDVVYYATAFVGLEKSPISKLKGTDFLVADNFSGGHMFTKEQQEQLKTRIPAALKTEEETVLIVHTVISNKGSVPRYAWFKTPRPGTSWWNNVPYTFNYKNGFSSYNEDQVFCISRLNGKPLPNEEVAVLLQPGEEAVIEFFVPHSPVSKERAGLLATLDYNQKLSEVKDFWLGKLDKAAQIDVPERRINEMIKAGLLHLDLITYGNEPEGTLAPNIGVYSPIGTESSPIIQFYASMGKLEEAKRSLNYFLDKQHEDGFIQNFGGYMVETGAALWSMGEYYRYSRDVNWVRSVKDKLIKSCDYLITWRNKNKKDELTGKGYGMIDGKVADPEDQFHQFMLNGYAYLGLSRIAEVLKEVDPAASQRINTEAEAWKQDIRESFLNAMARSPIIPLSDGTWCPTAPPWTEAEGPRALYQKRETYWSHGTFTGADAMLGPMYLVFCEVLNPSEPASKSLLNYHSELFYQGNAAFSQPYYSRHNWLQAKLGMVNPFLNTYYYTVSAHADRETYTFWEHMYRVSPHKTHEEAWFLMETRWMLYMENGDTLSLFRTIPRKWMEDGKTISLNGARSYFGKLNVKATSHVNEGYIEAAVSGEFNTNPHTVTVRLPHPEGKIPHKVEGGRYDAATETVIIEGFMGKKKVLLYYFAVFNK